MRVSGPRFGESREYGSGRDVDSRGERERLDALRDECRDGPADWAQMGEARRQKAAWMDARFGKLGTYWERLKWCPKCGWQVEYNEWKCRECGTPMVSPVKVTRRRNGDGRAYRAKSGEWGHETDAGR